MPTSTFVFSDIEGSTRLWQAHPEAMKGALAVHDSLIADAVSAHGGRVFKHTVTAVFESARGAVLADLYSDAAEREGAHHHQTLLAFRAGIDTEVGHHGDAARAFGASQALTDRGVGMRRDLVGLLERARQLAQEALGQSKYKRSVESGRKMSVEDITRFLLTDA